MSESPNKGQQERTKTPDEIRAERISNLTDETRRTQILQLQGERDAKVRETREKQQQKFAERVALFAAQKARSRNGPHPAPQGMGFTPALSHDMLARLQKEAELETRASDQRYLKLEAETYERKIDRLLDTAEKRRDDHQLGRPDRGDR